MATKREEAQKRRAEDRRKRRANTSGNSDEAKQDDASADEPLDAVKHAAKVAAAAAAVGAAMGAARAMSGGGDHDEAPEPPSEPDEPRAEQEEPRAGQEAPRQGRAEEHDEPEEAEEREGDRHPSGARPEEVRRVAAAAREQLASLLGKRADAVSGLERTDDGWVVTLDVVELSRIPESTDVLASYELELDHDRNLVRYSRGRRFYRSQADDGELP